MKVEMEKLEGNNIRLDIEVEREKVDEALDKAYRNVVQEVKMPGFRKGRVPRQVLEARLGKKVLYQEAIEIMLPEVLGAAIKEKSLEAIDQPSVENIHFEKGEPARLQVKVEVDPEVELGQYTGLNIEQQEISIDPEDIEQVLQKFQEQQAALISSDREEVQDRDYVVIDFEGFLEGEPFEGGQGEDVTLGIGTGTFIPGFEEKLIGARVGEEKEIEITFPEDYQDETLAGQEVTFQVKVREIKERELPPLDDELAQTVGDYESLEQLKKEIEESIRKRAQEESRVQFENEVLDAIANQVEVDIPDKLIEQRMEEMYQETAASVKEKGLEFEDYLQMTGKSKEEWMEENRPSAEKQVRNRLIIDTVAEKEGFIASEEEVENKMEEIATESGNDPEQFKTILKAQGYNWMLEKEIARKKVLDFLWEKNIKGKEQEQAGEYEEKKEDQQ